MIRTSVPGIYLRGTKYVITYRDSDGRQRKESYTTLREAKQEKAKRAVHMAEGTYSPETHTTLHDYADTWVERYVPIRENTRDDYRIGLKYAKEFFPYRLKLTQVYPKQVADYIAFLANKGLATSSIRKYLAPLKKMFATAREEGLLRSNPCHGVSIPRPPVFDEDEDDVIKAFSRDQLAGVLDALPKYGLLFRFLACTGLRISEALALEWRHLELYGDRPHVKVRRGIVRGTVGAPKSKYGKRVVPLPMSLTEALRMDPGATWVTPGRDLADVRVFPYTTDNVRRYARGVLDSHGYPWAGLHTFRHTFASLHIAQGTNLVALSRVMGHHSAAFTLKTYGHLLEGDEAPALEISSTVQELPASAYVNTKSPFGI
jgi:integrase